MHLYNSLSRKKELFQPIVAGQVGLYVCGPTVYSDCHVGHGRILIWFDVLVRYLQQLGYQVNYVRNLTDVDDKIIHRAGELHITPAALATEMIASLRQDELVLQTLKPNFEPKVTEHLVEIIELIQVLLAKGVAYLAAGGDVYFSVEKFAQYGKLSHRDLLTLTKITRMEVNPEKKNQLDFVLWKQAKVDEPAWTAPWGKGRPGWHIECSAMAKKYLGVRFDIHGGGMDLSFPHHENEIAQSEAAHGVDLANCWMHVGLVANGNEKMSKSLNNFFTLKEVLSRYHGEVFRYFILSSHYRSAIVFSYDGLTGAETVLRKLYLAIQEFEEEGVEPSEVTVEFGEEYRQAFTAAMDDDLNTPKVLTILFKLAKEITRLQLEGKRKSALKLAILLRQLAGSLGLLQSAAASFLQYGIDVELAEKLINQREAARKCRDWSRADFIRAQLQASGVSLQDGKVKTSWLVEDRASYRSDRLQELLNKLNHECS